MKRFFLPGAAVAVLLLGCHPGTTTMSEAERTAAVAEITAARDAYFEAATSFDAAAMVAFWDEDFVHVSNAEILPLTQEAMTESWKPLDRIEMDVSFDRVVALSRDAGYSLLVASYVVYDKAGNAVASSNWAGTHIWARTADGWKVHAVHEGRPVGGR